MVRCDVVMANDVSGPVAFRQLAKMGVERVFDPGEIAVDGARYEAAPIAPLVGELQAAGGLVPWTAERAARR